MRYVSIAGIRSLSALCRSAAVLAIAAGVTAPIPVRADEQVTLAMAGFDFVDTSGEVRDQTAEHDRRLAALDQTIVQTFSGSRDLRTVPLICEGKCTAATAGLETLSTRALEAGASHLLIGQGRKMSTLVGGVKFAVIDLGTNKPTCDRFLSYRGDTDEAWSRAAAFAAQDVAKYCLPEQ